ncbi:MAG TPA: TatD family hydrolase [Fusobacterium sp.]|uniref:TatD family hydrolase n=1 Tax=Fusobacterium sp. TaxID=68766 RepID=UPI002F3F495C
MKRIDSHVHLNDERFDKDREEVLQRIQKEMDFVVNIGYDLESSQISMDYARKYSFIYATVGLHPAEEEEYTEALEEKFEKMAKEEKVLAIGEIGLDYHWMTKSKELQKEIFRRQLALAERVGKPVVIHTREAMEDTVRILQEFPKVKGILHCYPGSVETAKQMIDRFYLGIGGVLTFKNAKKLVDVVKEIPLEHLILETDCPYMAPTPYRGQRNEPIYTKEVAMKIAEVKGISYEEVVEVTNKNTRKAYGML